MKKMRLLFIYLIFLNLSINIAAAKDPATASAKTNLSIYNRSSYEMFASIFNNGLNCSGRMSFEPDLNINGKKANIRTAANSPIAVGVAIFQMQGKSPVMCDYILSFTLNAQFDYLLEYDVHDRRCYGQLFRLTNGKHVLVTEGDPERIIERFPEFGWDQYEPGCTKN